MDEPNVNQTAEETAATTNVTPLPVQKTATAKKAVKRSIEDLHNLNPSKMTDAEKNDYIKALREENTLLVNKANAFENNCKSAYEQHRQLNQKYSDLKTQAVAKLNWAKQCVDHCRTAIILAGNLEEINDKL
jgi:hypothetical protein